MSSLAGRRAHAKIKTAAEIAAIVGPRPRSLKVAMCHGTFDIVHPGHVRHLTYAAGKADLLIASVTADRHVSKGGAATGHRPHVPERMRAENLAAYECVDYVLVDDNPTPLANIAIIKPDLFAKGYDYAGNTSLRTAEERMAVEAYGGQMLFTPGDIVNSSTRLLGVARPNLAAEKLAALLAAENLDFADLRAALASIAGMVVHVVGDTIVDSVVRCAVIGASGKTPTLSVRRESEARYAGGAAVVALHLAAAGAAVTFSTVLGDDAAGDFVLTTLGEAGVACQAVVEPGRPTTVKAAITAGGFSLLKLDTVDNRPLGEALARSLAQHIASTPADAVVLSDFRHGLFNRDSIPALTAAIPTGTFRAADSQVASRWGNVLDFAGFDLLCANEREARFALGDQDSAVRPLGSALYAAAGCGTLLLKMGAHGALAFRNAPAGTDDARAFFALDAFAADVVDAVGSGDAMLAYAAPVLCSTGNAVLAAALGSLAAAVACERAGNVPVTRAEVAAKLDAVERVVTLE